MTRRREFIALLGGTAAWPFATAAQQRDRMRRVGVLMNMSEDDPDAKPRFVAFQQGLEKLGWSEGYNIHLDVRFAVPANEQQVQMLVKELLALSPDVVMVVSTGPTAASNERAEIFRLFSSSWGTRSEQASLPTWHGRAAILQA
jgi:putative ABC transport system substrate-binding protein